MIGQHHEKQVDGAHPGEALLLHAPENGDPPRWQAVVSSAHAKRHAVPSFFEWFCHCGRDDCDSEAVSEKLRDGLNIVLKGNPNKSLTTGGCEGVQMRMRALGAA